MIVPLAVVAAPAATALAYTAADTGGVDLTSLLGTVVTPVIVILLLLTGKLRTEGEVKNRDETIRILRQQNTDKDVQLTALQAGVVEKAIPALTRTALILERLTPDPQFRER
jgi:hypothetical protein